jgi:hypothetical protein
MAAVSFLSTLPRGSPTVEKALGVAWRRRVTEERAGWGCVIWVLIGEPAGGAAPRGGGGATVPGGGAGAAGGEPGAGGGGGARGGAGQSEAS